MDSFIATYIPAFDSAQNDVEFHVSDFILVSLEAKFQISMLVL